MPVTLPTRRTARPLPTHRRIASTILTAATLGLALCGTAGAQTAPPPSPPPVSTTPVSTTFAARHYAPVFDIYLGGVWLAEMRIEAQIGDRTYAAAARLSTEGVVGALYEASFEAEATGRIAARQWVPQRFAADSRDSRNRQSVALRYGAGRLQALEAEPPFKPKPWEIDPLAQTGAVDPLSGALSALAAQPEDRLCDRTVEIFDGRRRYAISLAEPEPRGERRRCAALFKRVAGYKPKQMAKPDFAFEIWFSQGADRLWQVDHAAGPTDFGTATIRRRGLKR